MMIIREAFLIFKLQKERGLMKLVEGVQKPFWQGHVITRSSLLHQSIIVEDHNQLCFVKSRPETSTKGDACSA
jgi:hypothetical protein